jgi:hypothetical protein
MFPDPVRGSTLERKLVRAVWILGPAVPIALAGLIAQEPGYSILDVWFVMATAAAVVARYVDVSKLRGTTLFGEVATMAHVRGYSLKLLMTATGAWSIAHWAPSVL